MSRGPRVARTMLFALFLAMGIPASISAWGAYYGDLGLEHARALVETTSGNILVIGDTEDYRPYYYDIWALELDPDGEIVWQRAYGLEQDEIPRDLIRTSDGGYAVAGQLRPGVTSYWDAFVMKLDASGFPQWTRAYGGDNVEDAKSLLEVSGGGYVVAVSTSSFGSGGLWLLRLDTTGSLLWQKVYPDVGSPRAVVEGWGGGFLVATHDSILHTDGDGNVVWWKTYQGSGILRLKDLIRIAGGGYAAAGYINDPAIYNYDFVILRLDADGEVVWQKRCGDSSVFGVGWALVETAAGDLVLTGQLGSAGTSSDAWVARFHRSGDLQWQRRCGGPDGDLPYDIVETTGGDLVLASWSTGRHRPDFHDFFGVFRLDSSGDPQTNCVLSEETALPVGMYDATVTLQSLTPIETNGLERDLSFQTADTSSSHFDMCACPPAIAPPEEVSPAGHRQPLVFLDRETLAWQSWDTMVCRFHLYRGDVSRLPVPDYGSCLVADTVFNSIRDPELPPAGTCWFYLVTGVNSQGEGPMGFDSSGNPRVNTNPCP